VVFHGGTSVSNSMYLLLYVLTLRIDRSEWRYVVSIIYLTFKHVDTVDIDVALVESPLLKQLDKPAVTTLSIVCPARGHTGVLSAHVFLPEDLR
jgi:hypothetical protein